MLFVSFVLSSMLLVAAAPTDRRAPSTDVQGRAVIPAVPEARRAKSEAAIFENTALDSSVSSVQRSRTAG